MNMVKTIGILLVVIVVVFMIWLFFRRSAGPEQVIFDLRQSPLPTRPEAPATPPPSPTPTTSPSPTAPSQAREAIIEITTSGFSPATVTVPQGATVRFVNKDTASHWPASDAHPTHALCPGFDALRGLAQGESYSFTFTERKECPFHDHFKPSLKGTIKAQ